jgi:hypothetical protein
MGLYVAGGLSAGAGVTFIATRLSRKQRESTLPTTSDPTEGDPHAASNDRIEG